ncbi:MAG: hypothetical protein ACJ746_31355 [Bryobacteraceae bacterium]
MAVNIEITGIYFLPPMTVARLGGAETPLENFTWVESPNTHGAGDTVIRPDTTLEVDDEGNIRVYLPSLIRFRESTGKLRPAAPFFELWAKVLVDKKPDADRPLTVALLHSAGGHLANVKFIVEVANAKAARRSGDPACSYSARAEVVANDHSRRQLLASSPNQPGTKPLVSSDRPIPLGSIQVPKPAQGKDLDVNLDVIRIRFTPARGEVYGPPSAGVAIAPDTQRAHEIVPPANRILNPDASWTSYNGAYSKYMNPEPSDTYDGADIGNSVSWGVVDDTCDGVILAAVTLGLRRFTAVARIFVAPPDFAPDRRPFLSLADDLVDRERSLDGNELVTQLEIADLFQRAYEASSLANLDAMRRRHLGENAGNGSSEDESTLPDGRPLPATNQTSMTAEDKPFAEKTAGPMPVTPEAPLPYSKTVAVAHSALADLESLLEFLTRRADRVKLLLRPPFGVIGELEEAPPAIPQPAYRDPRIQRDLTHDMRMPPFMRDSDAAPLSLTRRQYHQILTLIDKLAKGAEAVPAERSMAMVHSVAETATALPLTELEAHQLRVVKRRAAHEKEQE